MNPVNPIRIAVICLPVVVAVECLALLCPAHWSPLTVTLILRSVQIGCLTALIHRLPGARSIAGFSHARLMAGIRLGIIVSIAFGMAALAAGSILFAIGQSPITFIHVPLPHGGIALALFFLTAGFMGPIAEELVFRGIVYSSLKPLGILPAVFLSTLIFSLFHYQGTGLPLIQFTGGIVFAFSFERSGHIITPIIIHCLGNSALFSLSLL